jgi:NAD(P)-dependent dehydrogenase (short-subunit alcohol dehydrogenase family)
LKVLLFGSTGHIGSAVHKRLKRTHDVVVASRSTGLPVDIVDPDSIRALFEKVGQVDAVVATIGSVPFKPFEDLQSADFLTGLCNKALGQVEIVRQGIHYVTAGGSFTLTTGVVGREPIRTGAAAAMANGALEYFVPAAAVELPRNLRINAVSPTVLREAPEYHGTFPGFIQVPAATMAEAYVKSIEGAQTGRIYIVE